MIDQRERELEDEIAKLRADNEAMKGICKQVSERTALVRHQFADLVRQRDEAYASNRDYELMEWFTDFRYRASKDASGLLGTRWRRLTTHLKRLYGDPPGGGRQILRDFMDWERTMLTKDAAKAAKIAKKLAKVVA